jgi:prepilin-type N-terminal cleavage/methylation domain-containing protein
MRQRQELLTAEPAEAGMTLIELTIVLLIMSVVLAMAGSLLFSLAQTANRNDTMITDEQAASTVLAQISRDIRSAHAVTFAAWPPPTAVQPTQELELQMNQPQGQWVEWIYTPTAAVVNGATQTAHTLARYVSNAANGTFKRSAPVVSTPVNVVNGASYPVFQYFQGDGQQVASTTGSIETCTTRVEVIMQVATQKNLSAVANVNLTDDVAITDQEAQWETLQCRYI